MSKVDAQRAMREARYATIQASGPPRSAAARQAAPSTEPATAPTQRRRAAPAQADAEPPERLCGHRSIGNKSCQREAGHPEKNHRYK